MVHDNQSEWTVLECLQAGIVHDRIGIMAPFVSQVKEISSSLNRKAVEVSTVDRFQGRDKDVVIYSCTKSVENVASGRKTEVCGYFKNIFDIFLIRFECALKTGSGFLVCKLVG